MGFDIRGKVALVTGANRGIGKVITETLLDRGAAKVYAAVRRPDTAKPLADEHGDRVAVVEMDLAHFDSVSSAAKRAPDVELVVNNAGVLRPANLFEEEANEALQHEMDINVFGLIRVAHAFAPVLKANGGGAFVQLNSVASLRCFADFATYCASKAASYSITQALREKLATQGTLVVSIHPGPINTDMAQTAGLADIAEPPSLVAETMVAALETGEFHAWPGSTATKVGEAYQSFAANVVEAGN